MSQPLLESHFVSEGESALDSRFREIEGQIAELRKDIATLRTLFGNFFSAQKAIFSGTPGAATPAPQDGGMVWRERAAKVGGGKGRILEVLFDGGGQMSITQIRNAARTGGNTSTYLNDLSSRNWVENVGRGQWALK